MSATSSSLPVETGEPGNDSAPPTLADAATDSAPSSPIATLFRTAQVLLLSVSLAHVCLGVLAWRSLLGGAVSQGERSSGGMGGTPPYDNSSGSSSPRLSNIACQPYGSAAATEQPGHTVRASAAPMPAGSSACLPGRRVGHSAIGPQPVGHTVYRGAPPGSITGPSFGLFGTNRGTWCSTHKEPGMEDVTSRRCDHPDGCKRRPSFGQPGSKSGTRCFAHREPGMVDVVHRRCDHPDGCMTLPSFGQPGSKTVTRCSTHKEPGARPAIVPVAATDAVSAPPLPVTPGLSASAFTPAESPPSVAEREELHDSQKVDDDQQQASSTYSGNRADDRADDDQQVQQASRSKAVDVSCGGGGSGITAVGEEPIAVPGRGEPDHATLKAIVEEGVAKFGGSKDVAAAFADLEFRLGGLQQADTASDSNTLVTALSLFFDRWTPARGERKAMSAEEWER